MSRAGKWLVAVVVTVAAFGVSLWVCGALLLPLWLKSEADRWVVAAGLGVAVAALAALVRVLGWTVRGPIIGLVVRSGGSVDLCWRRRQRDRIDR